MKIDLRVPTIVITGAWNPAIFSPEWIVRNLFGKPEGATILVGELQRPPSSPVRYIENIGIAASFDRLEFYLNNLDENSTSNLEKIIGNVLEILSHTPLNGFGVNFEFLEETDDDLYSKLQTDEGIEELYTVKQVSIASVIAYGANVDLNFSRGISEDTIKFNFNYHHVGPAGFMQRKTFDGIIVDYLAKSKEMLRKLYGREDFEPFTHDFKVMREASQESKNGRQT